PRWPNMLLDSHAASAGRVRSTAIHPSNRRRSICSVIEISWSMRAPAGSSSWTNASLADFRARAERIERARTARLLFPTTPESATVPQHFQHDEEQRHAFRDG